MTALYPVRSTGGMTGTRSTQSTGGDFVTLIRVSAHSSGGNHNKQQTFLGVSPFLPFIRSLLSPIPRFLDRITEVEYRRTLINSIVNRILHRRSFPDDSEE